MLGNQNSCFIFYLSVSILVHPSGPNPEVLRLHQVWPLRHRLPREGLPGDRQRWQQRAQLPRQAAQRADEGGQLQGHAHEVLASHVLRKWIHLLWINSASLLIIGETVGATQLGDPKKITTKKPSLQRVRAWWLCSHWNADLHAVQYWHASIRDATDDSSCNVASGVVTHTN